MYEDYNNKSYSITAEQAKEVELKQEKEFLVYYLRKALGMVGDMKISEAIARLEKELEPKFEPSILNLKLESKTVKCEEPEGWTGWKVYPDSVYGRMEKFHDEHCCYCDNELCYGVYDEHGRDVCELYNEEFKADNKDGNTVYERVVVINEDGEDEESSPELFKKLQRFWHEHCTVCGTQRCLGVYDKEWREGCKLYKEEFCK